MEVHYRQDKMSCRTNNCEVLNPSFVLENHGVFYLTDLIDFDFHFLYFSGLRPLGHWQGYRYLLDLRNLNSFWTIKYPFCNKNYKRDSSDHTLQCLLYMTKTHIKNRRILVILNENFMR